MSALEMSFVPIVLDDNEELIEKSVDVQCLTGNVLNIASNFIASVLLGVVTYIFVLNVSLPFFVAGVYFFCKIHVQVSTDHDNNIQIPSGNSYAQNMKHLCRLGQF
ncbi:hypothetical protein QP141_05745 [Alloscardovia omnicolens]|uniref:hypothetical protein n=1 Tax=Alloscardovia omnicolens TaxID=419015 RepID=UPI0003B784B7|nr:hypothetical protein [Alloscardovia omnicolens]MDK6249933.1 hypothetical protein [Alloscardovia omnicolens]MDK6445313.1 hypothetical protein [Alloscardovia omnicolens]MDK6644104.1 hypothetical protein [Alloscardovia omnicolens]MDU6532296.1 hypothetical protein [Alloscardovia omnicolens]MDU6640438.1 hypothetical protein [Alloscardovia omnicolens]